MKNYSCKTAAQMLVQSNTMHGLSRRLNPELATSHVSSIMTENAHVQALKGYAKWLIANCDRKHLKNSTPDQANRYLAHRASMRRQSTVDLDRQAINLHMRFEDPLSFVTASIPTEPKNRAYSKRQIDLLVNSANKELGLSIQIAVNAGLRSMELVSIADLHQLTPSNRQWDTNRFAGRIGTVKYAVHGKGGLVREVHLSMELSDQLRQTARPTPSLESHRGAHLLSHFCLIAGHRFSIEFGQLSKRILGFSHGAHGLRHSFAQHRRTELLSSGFSCNESIEILSQELGHFSINNTLAYLRD